MKEEQIKYYEAFKEVAMVINNTIHLKANRKICKADAISMLHKDHKLVAIGYDSELKSDWFEVKKASEYDIAFRTHNSISCLKCGVIEKEMKKIGVFVMCDKCTESEFGEVKGIDCDTEAYKKTYREWLLKYQKG
jgi:hypothetical protein